MIDAAMRNLGLQIGQMSVELALWKARAEAAEAVVAEMTAEMEEDAPEEDAGL